MIKRIAIQILGRIAKYMLMLLVPTTILFALGESMMNPPPSCFLAMAQNQSWPSHCGPIPFGDPQHTPQQGFAQKGLSTALGIDEDMFARSDSHQRPSQLIAQRQQTVQQGQAVLDEGSLAEQIETNINPYLISQGFLWLLTGIVVLMAALVLWGASNKFAAVIAVGSLCILLGGGFLVAEPRAHLSCYISQTMYKNFQKRPFCTVDKTFLQRQARQSARELLLYEAEIVRMEQEFAAQAEQLTEQSRLRREALTLAEPADLTMARKQAGDRIYTLAQIEQEWKVRDIPLVPYARMLIAVGAVFVLAALGMRVRRTRKFKKLEGKVSFRKDAKEIDPEKYHFVADSGFATQKEAVEFLSHDFMHTCEYCEQPLEIEDLGEVTEMHYSKARPQDVSGAVVVPLGVVYFAAPVDLRTCGHCGHANHRNNYRK